MEKIFYVTVKDKSHDKNLPVKASEKVYKINDLDNPLLNLAQGSTYKFDQSHQSNLNYPINFYLDDTGESTTDYSKVYGLPGNPGSYTLLYLGKDAPASIKYESPELFGNKVIISFSTKDEKFKIGDESTFFDACGGTDTAIIEGKYDEYSFKEFGGSLIMKEKKSNANKSPISLQNVEWLKFSDQLVEKSKATLIKEFDKNFNDYEFIQDEKNEFFIKNDFVFDKITGIPKLIFADKSISAIKDISETFDLITGKNNSSGQIFRLHKAAFNRFPDSEGLSYWIEKYDSGQNTKREIAKSFLDSYEFKNSHGVNISDEKYVETLYTNILGRLPDTDGMQYWFKRLSIGAETRAEVLLGFSESNENQAIFSETTGLF
tara:strand:+ start:38 stop:1165 length:1128 start_codon:yes stop_codon:yes gene_type:complete